MKVTLQEALTSGTGIERPFTCPVHDDRNPSASVNVQRRVWFCYSCGAGGRLPDDVEPDYKALTNRIRALLDGPQERPWTATMIDLHSRPHPYWRSRFSEDAVQHFALGSDPATGRAAYPVRSSTGGVVGIVTREVVADSGAARYLYPAQIRMGQHLFNYTPQRVSALVLTEGATDAIAAWEAGVHAVGTYRNGISESQAALVRRMDPDIVWVAYDQELSGRRGYRQVKEMLGADLRVEWMEWDAEHKDLASMPLDTRSHILDAHLHRASSCF